MNGAMILILSLWLVGYAGWGHLLCYASDKLFPDKIIESNLAVVIILLSYLVLTGIILITIGC